MTIKIGRLTKEIASYGNYRQFNLRISGGECMICQVPFGMEGVKARKTVQVMVCGEVVPNSYFGKVMRVEKVSDCDAKQRPRDEGLRALGMRRI